MTKKLFDFMQDTMCDRCGRVWFGKSAQHPQPICNSCLKIVMEKHDPIIQKWKGADVDWDGHTGNEVNE